MNTLDALLLFQRLRELARHVMNGSVILGRLHMKNDFKVVHRVASIWAAEVLEEDVDDSEKTLADRLIATSYMVFRADDGEYDWTKIETSTGGARNDGLKNDALQFRRYVATLFMIVNSEMDGLKYFSRDEMLNIFPAVRHLEIIFSLLYEEYSRELSREQRRP